LPSDQLEWALRFKERMVQLGAPVCVEKLTDTGLKLWKIYGPMRPEDVAEFEVRMLPWR
jgi:hypothetical protein